MGDVHRSRPRLLAALAPLLALAGCPDTPPPAPPDAAVAEAPPRPPPGIRLAADAAGPDLVAGDLPAIRTRGTLRVLVPGSEANHLPRHGSLASRDRELAREFGLRHGLAVEFLLVERRDQLIPFLLEGRGDVIAAQLTVTSAREAQVAFTRPTVTVDEILVAPHAEPQPPRSPADLQGREVHVRASSSYAETLRQLAAEAPPGPRLVPAPEHLETEEIAFQVSQGQRPLTLVDSHLLAEIEAYNDGLKRCFALATGRQLAWAVRPQARELKAALDAFLIEHAMTGHTRRRSTGDLDAIREWGELRVLTRNNAVTYFLHRGRQRGFEYELARLLADDLGLRLAMVVPPSRDLLVPWLREGRGDLIAASLTVTPERQKTLAFSRPYLFVEEVLVQRRGAPALAGRADLARCPIHVRASSSYRQTLGALAAAGVALTVVDAPETQETEELIARVGAGEIPCTVADSHIVKVEQTYRDDIQVAFPLTGPPATGWGDLTSGSKRIAFALRPDNPRLKAYLDRFVARIYRGLEYNLARKRYFDNRKRIAEAKAEGTVTAGRLSPYDGLIRKYAARHGLDWRLLAAMAYQESRFDPKARSWVGAQGLFQVMPATGRELGFTDLEDPEQGIHAGVRYLHRLLSRLDPNIPFRQRVRFALAGYNAGIGHVADARRLAARRGLNPDRWFENVAEAMLLLQRPRFYRHARHGYCRGSEPVRYVSEIQNRYDNYVKILPR